MVDVPKVPDEAPVNQQVQPLLGQTHDVHGVPADEIGDPIQSDGGTVGVHAVEHLPAVVVSQLQFLPAAAAVGGEDVAAGAGQVVRDHGDDLVGLDDGDGVPQSQLQFLDDAHIV